jgi:hypothetical protein
MVAYLYVLWAVEDELVKIGISKRLLKRLADHSGNSSNPLNLQPYKIYQFSTTEDAHKVEKLALQRLTKQGFSYRDKKELFKCNPTDAVKVIEQLCYELKISMLRDFPINLEEILERLADFPCLPEFALELFTPDQRRLYWKGARDAFRCISYFDEETGAELWTAPVDYYRNHGLLDSSEQDTAAARDIAWAALEKIKIDRRFAYIDWQQIDDDDDDPKT